ncbi:pyrimidine and pyridine-specific 5'-nucleotidase [Acrasis kona]|uniref:Pyrimidine and pyridine-specific 5'-nucleotidase n=1 Tax=Acrasis kona TaxID=1008807 RepID=A0AAW2ZFP1_9EUKA
MTVSKPQKTSKILFLDLDDTLYHKSSGVASCVSQRIGQYLREVLKIEDADKKAYDLYQQWGTTLKGLLEEGYDIDPIEFYKYVHSGFDIDDKITKDDIKLQNLLIKLRKSHPVESFDFKIFIFTNADRRHCFRFVDHLNIRQLVDGFICFEDMLLLCKPHPDSFHAALKMALKVEYQEAVRQHGEANVGKWWENWEVYFADDNINNVKAAIDYGWKVVWVQESGNSNVEGVTQVRSILEIENIFPELFNASQ